jgi:NAD(P)-dependent dehydrogenase (short-subunit alcohol dehydrogenase family)
VASLVSFFRPSYEGKRVWITGGGSGIGRALALELAARGADVAVSGRRAERLAEVASAIDELGRRGLAIPCDVTDEAQVAAAADEAAKLFGGLDVAVANAGFSVSGPVETLDAEDWRRQLDVNVVGAAITAKHALQHLRPTRGRLAFVGSVAAFLGCLGAAPTARARPRCAPSARACPPSSPAPGSAAPWSTRASSRARSVRSTTGAASTRAARIDARRT